MNSSDYSYVFDDIGNRMTSAVNSVSSAYFANQLNQYASITGGAAASPTYDSDGNMTYDGSTWHHTYDAENRLTASSPNTVTNGSYMLEYKLNHNNLRVEKIRKQLSGRDPGYPMNPQADPGTWNKIKTRRYIWDGYNIAAEIIIDHVIPATNISFYTWGIDLSGSLQGAGGVGGLLGDTKVSSTGTNTFYSLCDGNGNITEYIDDTGTVKAHGEHNAFGETKLDGSMKDDFTHWFSSKPLDKTTGLISYELRYLKPDFAWLSRDLIGERDAPGLYLFLRNEPVNQVDYLGRESRHFPKLSVEFIGKGPKLNGSELWTGIRYRAKRVKCACIISKLMFIAIEGNSPTAESDLTKEGPIFFYDDGKPGGYAGYIHAINNYKGTWGQGPGGGAYPPYFEPYLFGYMKLVWSYKGYNPCPKDADKEFKQAVTPLDGTRQVSMWQAQKSHMPWSTQKPKFWNSNDEVTRGTHSVIITQSDTGFVYEAIPDIPAGSQRGGRGNEPGIWIPKK